MSALSLRVSIPILSLRKPYSREFLETERIPPPSTVYGFLLALIGEEDRKRYIGTRLAMAVLKSAEVSTIIRTAWRVKKKTAPLGTGSNRRPDFQEILTGLEIGVWIQTGALADRLTDLGNPERISRYGALSLGESRDLVDEVELGPDWGDRTARWLIRNERGRFPLPIWVDHVGSEKTRWGQFEISEAGLETPGPDDPRWVTIKPL